MSEQVATKDQLLVFGHQKPRWSFYVSQTDWSTPYFRVGSIGGMNFAVVQILCFSITRYWA